MYSTRSYHTVQEIQKYNIPDYRPRMEQFQKAIRKVRAVQRLRRNRGFAFSQNESGQVMYRTYVIKMWQQSFLVTTPLSINTLNFPLNRRRELSAHMIRHLRNQPVSNNTRTFFHLSCIKFISSASIINLSLLYIDIYH